MHRIQKHFCAFVSSNTFKTVTTVMCIFGLDVDRIFSNFKYVVPLSNSDSIIYIKKLCKIIWLEFRIMVHS